jgi:hypothetical protein
MPGSGNGPLPRRRPAPRRRLREAQILDAFDRLRRSDRRVHDALVILLGCALRSVQRRTQPVTGNVPPAPGSPR